MVNREGARGGRDEPRHHRERGKEPEDRFHRPSIQDTVQGTPLSVKLVGWSFGPLALKPTPKLVPGSMLLWKLGPVTWTLGGVAEKVPFQPVARRSPAMTIPDEHRRKRIDPPFVMERQSEAIVSRAALVVKHLSAP
jgi:hypothetical protein